MCCHIIFIIIFCWLFRGLLFELLGQSIGDPNHEEEDIPIVLRSWRAQSFLVTTMHVKGPSSNINVLGVTEVQVSNSECFMFKLAS
jgi:hypothetical protein